MPRIGHPALVSKEVIQDNVGNILVDTSSINFTYDDTNNQITADVIPAGLYSDLDTRYVNITGDTMTGLLTLSGVPTADLHAATKKYVDDNIGAGGGATVALDNLASVAINTSLLSDTADTYDLGSATKEWRNLYIGDAGKIYLGLGQDASIERSAANEMTLTATSGVTIEGVKIDGGVVTGASSITSTGFTGALTGNADTVTNATLTTALTVDTGTLTLTANVANNSVLTIGAGASSISGANTGDQDLSGLASKALDDLDSVAINASLVPATDSAIDLGSSTPKYFANAYIDKLFISANNTLEFTTDHLSINKLGDAGIYLFESADAGSMPNKEFRIYGWDSADDVQLEYAKFYLNTEGSLVIDAVLGQLVLQPTGGIITIGNSIRSDTDSTDNLGTSSNYWANAYIDKLTLSNAANADLLVFNTERAWKFTTSGSGASTTLDLMPLVDVKSFRIVDSAQTNVVFSVLASTTVANQIVSLVLGGGNVGINEGSPSARLEVNGDVLVKDKIAFTQDDKNEYIDSLNDGYMDYGATTQHRFIGPSVRVQGDLYIGNDTTTDPILIMTGQDHDGTLTWMETEDYFEFNDLVKATFYSTSLSQGAIQSMSNDGAIAVANSYLRVVGNLGAVTLSADPAIANGITGQVIVIEGTNDANTVTINDSVNTQLAGGAAVVLGLNDTITLIFNGTDWCEISRSNN